MRTEGAGSIMSWLLREVMFRRSSGICEVSRFSVYLSNRYMSSKALGATNSSAWWRTVNKSTTELWERERCSNELMQFSSWSWSTPIFLFFSWGSDCTWNSRAKAPRMVSAKQLQVACVDRDLAPEYHMFISSWIAVSPSPVTTYWLVRGLEARVALVHKLEYMFVSGVHMH